MMVLNVYELSIQHFICAFIIMEKGQHCPSAGYSILPIIKEILNANLSEVNGFGAGFW